MSLETGFDFWHRQDIYFPFNATKIGCRPHKTSTATSPRLNHTERDADHLTPSVSRLRMSSFILPLPPIQLHHVHNDNFTLRELTNFLTRRIDILEHRLLKVSNFTGPHIRRSSHRSSLKSVGYCTNYFGLSNGAYGGGGGSDWCTWSSL